LNPKIATQWGQNCDKNCFTDNPQTLKPPPKNKKKKEKKGQTIPILPFSFPPATQPGV